MISTLLFFQIISLIAYLTLAMMLLICPYEGEEFRNYTRARHLFMGSMSLVATQFAIQMIFGFRARDAVLGTAVNLIFFAFGDMLYSLGVLRVLRGNRSCTRELRALMTYCIANAVVLAAAAYFLTGTPWLTWLVYGSTFMYIMVFITFSILLMKEYSVLRHKIQENYAIPLEQEGEWIKHYLIFRISYCILFPCLAVSSTFAITFSCICFVAFVYIEVKFIYFGYFVKSFEAVENDNENDNENESESGCSTVSTLKQYANENTDSTEMQMEHVSSALREWVEAESYCDKDVTLISLAQTLNINQHLLSLYFSTMEHKTFRQWINTHRVEKAKRMMKQHPQFSNETIARECGFSSRSVFQNGFRTHEGIAPGEWMKKNC